ncbi:MAG: hypothetical protein AAFY59_19240 [Pseudomonadota bacterium]
MAEKKEEKKSFWSTLTGLITAVASLIAAVGGLIFGLYEVGILERPGQGGAGQAALPHVFDGNEATEGWSIIGKAEGLDYRDMLLLIDGDAPARGRVYIAIEDFRLISQSPQEIGNGGQTITLGMVCKGDRVKVLDLFVPSPSTQEQFVHAKLEAELEEIGGC